MNPSHWLVILVMTTAALGLADKRLTPAIRTYAVQALLVGLFVLAEGLHSGGPAVLAFGGLILLTKGILTPAYIGWVSRRFRTGRELDPYLNIPLSLVAAGLCFLVSVVVVHAVDLAGLADPVAVVAGFSTVLIGLLTMATRRKAVVQALGLLTMENGAFLLSVVLAGGLPLAVELAVLLDVLVLVVLLGIFFGRIRETFDHLDVGALSTLGD